VPIGEEHQKGATNVTKKCHIVLRLLKEAEEIDNEEIAREIKQEIKMNLHLIPWAEDVEKVTVSEN